MLATMESRPCRVAARITREPSGSMARERRGPAARLATLPVDPLRVRRTSESARQAALWSGRILTTVGQPDPKLTHAPMHHVPRQSVPHAHMTNILTLANL